MKKTFFLLAAFVVFSSAVLAAGAPKEKTAVAKASKAKSSKTKTAAPAAGLCLAIFDLPCGMVLSFMDCGDMECVTDWGWEQKWNGYNTKYCSPIQLANGPVAFG